MHRIQNLILIIIATALILTGCKRAHENKETVEAGHHEHDVNQKVIIPTESIRKLGILCITVAEESYTGQLSVPARVLTPQDNEALIGSPVAGRVAKVLVKAGDRVHAGQGLMLVEGLEIGVIKAGYLKAKAQLDFQKAAYERVKLLHEQKIGAQKTLLESKAEYEKALAEFTAEDKKIHAIGLTDDYVTASVSDEKNAHTSGTLLIRSPITGVVAERNVVIGQLVDASLNAFRIVNTVEVWADGQVYEKDLSRVKVGASVVFLPNASSGVPHPGKIVHIGQSVDERSGTVAIRAEFRNPKGELMPNMFGTLQMAAGAETKGILLPEEAIVRIADKSVVFVQDADSVFSPREVVTGTAIGKRVPILQGITAGSPVVVKGAFFIKSELMKSELEEEGH